MDQRKLTSEEITATRQATIALLSLPDDTWQAGNWAETYQRLVQCITHDTNDGLPYVEPAVVEVFDDKWAAVWPRRWVMCRDYTSDDWTGPHQLLGVAHENNAYRYRIAGNGVVAATSFKFMRPATGAEIATANCGGCQSAAAESTDRRKLDIGEGYREATDADRHRTDVDVYWTEKWCRRAKEKIGHMFETHVYYRVPLDEVPTEQDAHHRVLVMVRDSCEAKWEPRNITAILRRSAMPFITVDDKRKVFGAWKYARKLYPGESVDAT